MTCFETQYKESEYCEKVNNILNDVVLKLHIIAFTEFTNNSLSFVCDDLLHSLDKLHPPIVILPTNQDW